MLDVRLMEMRLTGDRKQYWPQIICDGRTFETRCYTHHYRNRAQYEVDELRHVLLGDPKPDLADPKYADTEEKSGD